MQRMLSFTHIQSFECRLGLDLSEEKEKKLESISKEYTHDNHLQILLYQYRECLSFIRMRANQIWQLPSISMAINSFLGIMYLEYANTFESKIVVLLSSLFFTFILTIQLRKFRFLQEARNIDFRAIQTELQKSLKEDESIRLIELRTKQIWKNSEAYPNLTRSWWTRQGAYKWFSHSMYATMFVYGMILLYEVTGFLTLHAC